MSEKFTPGPWRVEKRHAVHSGKRRTANANVMNHRIPYMEKKANAHLISAAPDMYEAMKEFCDRCDKGEVRSKRTYAKFMEILKKARGES